jgi:indole-3-glycerol phosphate synthase
MAAETVLDRIVGAVRGRLEVAAPRPDLAEAALAAAEARRRSGRRSLAAALAGGRGAVIAECKHASPSAGVLRQGFDPAAIARRYEAAGAAAISVVTEPDFFAGDPAWVAAVRQEVALPVMRKDFIVTPRQVLESAAGGADAVLLIARLLDRETMAELLEVAASLDLEVLLEVFVDEDPEDAVASGAEILGVNARDLSTFDLDLDRVAVMAKALPTDRVRVAESGISCRGDLLRLRRAGYDAFLVGTHLVTAEDPGAALAELLGR